MRPATHWYSEVRVGKPQEGAVRRGFASKQHELTGEVTDQPVSTTRGRRGATAAWLAESRRLAAHCPTAAREVPIFA